MLLLLPVLACNLVNDLIEESTTPETTAENTPATHTATAENNILPIENTPVPLSTEAGMACLGTSGYGLTCLDENGWHTFTSEDGLNSDYLYDLTTCPDGRLLALDSSGISQFDGKSWTIVEGGWGFGSPEAFACTAEGNIWVAHFEGVSLYQNGSWTTYSAEQLATGDAISDLVYDVTVAPDGKVWVVASNSIASYDGTNWTIYQEGQGFDKTFFFEAIAIDHLGTPWVLHSSGLLAFEDNRWQPFESSDFFTVESLAIDAQNRVWVGTFADGASLFNGQNWAVYNTETSELSSDRIQTMAIDGRNRVWFGTDWGLAVLDGSAWQVYHMHTADIASNNISSLVVVAGGPPLPATAEKEPGAMSGELVNEDDEVIPNALVEICVNGLGATFYGDTPCSDQPFFLSTTSNSDGNFVFNELPAGRYIITVKTGKNDWAQLTTDFGLSERITVEPGEEVDLGELIVGD